MEKREARISPQRREKKKSGMDKKEGYSYISKERGGGKREKILFLLRGRKKEGWGSRQGRGSDFSPSGGEEVLFSPLGRGKGGEAKYEKGGGGGPLLVPFFLRGEKKKTPPSSSPEKEGQERE